MAGRTALGAAKKVGGAPAEAVATEIQRRTVEQLCRTLGELKGGALKLGQAMSVFEAVMPEELDGASEVFLCATAAEIVPVGAIDHRRYQVGPMTRALIDDYQKLVRQPDCEGFGESAHLGS